MTDGDVADGIMRIHEHAVRAEDASVVRGDDAGDALPLACAHGFCFVSVGVDEIRLDFIKHEEPKSRRWLLRESIQPRLAAGAVVPCFRGQLGREGEDADLRQILHGLHKSSDIDLPATVGGFVVAGRYVENFHDVLNLRPISFPCLFSASMRGLTCS